MKSKPSTSGLLGPVKSQTLDSAVIDALAAYVEEARIAPGERLPSERMLCDRLKVSRPTVREALKRWEALGIVEMRKGSGVYLRKAVGRNILHVPLVLSRSTKVKDLLHGLQVRRALEGEAAAICASSASADRIAMIEKALIRMDCLAAQQPVDRAGIRGICHLTRERRPERHHLADEFRVLEGQIARIDASQ